MKKILGLRTIKTGVALALAIFVAQILEIEYPFFVGMTAIISMDKTMTNSLKMGRNRVVGTFLGACIGVLLSYVDRGNPLLCGVGIMMLILICNRLRLQGSITIGGIVMIAIMVHTDKTPLFYGFHRTFDTLIGALVSLFVNVVLFPYANDKRLNNIILQLWEQTDKIVNALRNGEKVNTTSLNQEMDMIRNELDLYHHELLGKDKRDLVNELRLHYDMAEHLMLEIEILETIDKDKYPEVYQYHIDSALNVHNLYIDEVQLKHKTN